MKHYEQQSKITIMIFLMDDGINRPSHCTYSFPELEQENPAMRRSFTSLQYHASWKETVEG